MSRDYGHANSRRYIFVKAAPMTFHLHKFSASNFRHPNWLYQFESGMKTVNKQSMLAPSELLETFSTPIHLTVICLRGEREHSDWSLFSDENVSTLRLGNYSGCLNVGWALLNRCFRSFHSFQKQKKNFDALVEKSVLPYRKKSFSDENEIVLKYKLLYKSAKWIENSFFWNAKVCKIKFFKQTLTKFFHQIPI